MNNKDKEKIEKNHPFAENIPLEYYSSLSIPVKDNSIKYQVKKKILNLCGDYSKDSEIEEFVNNLEEYTNPIPSFMITFDQILKMVDDSNLSTYIGYLFQGQNDNLEKLEKFLRMDFTIYKTDIKWNYDDLTEIILKCKALIPFEYVGEIPSNLWERYINKLQNYFNDNEKFNKFEELLNKILEDNENNNINTNINEIKNLMNNELYEELCHFIPFEWKKSKNIN